MHWKSKKNKINEKAGLVSWMDIFLMCTSFKSSLLTAKAPGVQDVPPSTGRHRSKKCGDSPLFIVISSQGILTCACYRIEIYFTATDYITSFKADLSKLAKDTSDFTIEEFCP